MRVILSKDANNAYERLPQADRKKVRKKLYFLEQNPLSGKSLVGELKGKRSLRAWPYRIIYKINSKESIIEIDDIRHRQGAYK